MHQLHIGQFNPTSRIYNSMEVKLTQKAPKVTKALDHAFWNTAGNSFIIKTYRCSLKFVNC